MAKRIFADTRPLQNIYFRRLWTANIITVIGAQLTVVAVPAQLYAITGSSAYVGLAGIFGLVPLVVFGLWGGALADTYDRRRILIVTTIGLIVTSAAFWAQAAADLNNVWLLLMIFAVQQGFFAVNQPTRTAVLPRIISMEQLPAANSLNMTVMQAGAIAGPLVGGALIPFIGFSMLYAADAVFLFATLWAVVTLPPLPPEHTPGMDKPTAGFKSVIDGLVYLKGHKVLLMSFVVDLIAMIFGMPRALFPQIAHESFGGPTDGGLAFALLFIAIPLGAVVGGVLSGWVSHVRRQGMAVIICIIIWGLSIVVAGGVLIFAHGTMLPILPIVIVALMIGGAADMASAAFRQTMLQSAANDDVRGRLQGVFIVVVAGGPRIADVTHGASAAMVGTAVTFAGGGILVVVLTVVAAFAVPVFWRYRTSLKETDAT
ncbi:MFS transporter [Gordonia sp. (in: high G+C Gram-positive bacteria)]|uniref:MFS transporter n=1 Tax=Gordonia sp. (in: high G+C Gram-positive bacteria) TaxID=84139 RepID=UPI003C73D544